jgi:hypothetical protein
MPEYFNFGPDDGEDFNGFGYDDEDIGADQEDIDNEDYTEEYDTEMDLDDFDDDDDDMFEEEDILFSDDDDDIPVDQEQTEARKDIWSNMDWDKD